MEPREDTALTAGRWRVADGRAVARSASDLARGKSKSSLAALRRWSAAAGEPQYRFHDATPKLAQTLYGVFVFLRL